MQARSQKPPVQPSLDREQAKLRFQPRSSRLVPTDQNEPLPGSGCSRLFAVVRALKLQNGAAGRSLKTVLTPFGAVVSFRVPLLRGFMRHTISVLVENKFGVLTRIAGLFSGRGYNIDTLNVGPTDDPKTSRMTIVTRGDDATVEQIVKQLEKLTDVLEVLDFGAAEYIDRELVMVKVSVDSKSRAEVMQITDIFRAKIVDVQPKSLTIEITGNESKIEKFLSLMKTFGVLDLTRTGKVALPRK
jgi:acetolactate synthase-1/3 small subunit